MSALIINNPTLEASTFKTVGYVGLYSKIIHMFYEVCEQYSKF